MSKAKGTVSGCGKGKFSFFITLEEREGFYFNTKFEPKCGKGDVVGIEFTPKGDSRGNVQKVVILEKNSNGYEDTGSGGNKSGGGSGGGYKADPGRQDSIVFQSSRKDALALVGLLLQTETVKIPKGDKGRIVIEALVDEVTVRFFGDASDPKNSEAYKTNVSIEDDATPEKGGDDGWDEEKEEAPKKADEWDEWDD